MDNKINFVTVFTATQCTHVIACFDIILINGDISLNLADILHFTKRQAYTQHSYPSYVTIAQVTILKKLTGSWYNSNIVK